MKLLVIIPLIFVGCAYRNPAPSPPVKLHTLRSEPSAWDRTYTNMGLRGARGGNPPPYWLGKPTKDWQEPFGTFSDYPM